MRVVIQLRRRRRAPVDRQRRSVDSFDQLVRDHQSMVFSMARSIAQDASAAEEVARDVFLELHRKLGSLNSREQILHWLRRVTVQRSIDRAPLKQSRPQDHAALRLAEPAAEARDPRQGERLQQTMGTLPVVPRAVIVLRYQEGLMPEEIADLLGMPVARVKSHLQRALKVLRARTQPLRN